MATAPEQALPAEVLHLPFEAGPHRMTLGLVARRPGELIELDDRYPGEMAERLGISASLVSHHLRLLRAARLLGAERRGRQVFYVVGDLHIRSMLSDMVDHVAEEDAETEAAP